MSDGMLGNLDVKCPAPDCGRPYGDHTLRELNACTGATSHELAFEPVEDDLVEHLRRKFNLGDYIPVDTVTARAALLEAADGGPSLNVPAVLLDFSTGTPLGPPVIRAKIAFLGTVETVRGLGRLVRDTANGAANAVEKRAGPGRKGGR